MRGMRIFVTMVAIIQLESLPGVHTTDSSRTNQIVFAATAELEAAQQQTPRPDPPSTIDGAKNPELIPDEVAYRLLFLAVAEPENPTTEQKARARAKVNGAGLSEGDAEALISLLSKFHTEMVGIDAQLGQIADRTGFRPSLSADIRQVLQLNNQKERLVANTIAALPVTLSAV